MKIVFLGTSSAYPTEKRNHVAVLLKYNGESLLFDCGEGTQRQIRIAKENPMKISKIFLTHWHGDHVFGLPGLLQSLATSNRILPIEIYGPKGTKKKISDILAAFNIQLPFKAKIKEFSSEKEQKILEEETYEIYSRKVKHSIPTIAYYFKEKDKKKLNKKILAKYGLQNTPKVKPLLNGKSIDVEGKTLTPNQAVFIEKGKKISIVLDTEYFPELAEFVRNSDILISEGTFSNKLKEKAREKGGHMTVKDAAKLAKKSKSQQLYIFHFSQRYKNTKSLEKEATSVFKNTKLARDFDKISI